MKSRDIHHIVQAAAAARLINGAALWIAASEEPEATVGKAVDAFMLLAQGLLA
ncbi:hypothetical protein ACKC9G_10285 [Pokkaliibacter sp. CJK22405]|uniref:hypothetical protein n=1 Tax=Pokkaliibacter sp. CJK22405 TaxID=3384615 RepID=UPI0039851C8C